MTAQKGSLLLLKLGDGLSPTSYTTVAGLKNTSTTINGEMVDVTTKDSSGWRNLLAGAGISSMSITASGIFQNDSAVKTIRTNAMNRTVDSYQLVFGNSQIITGDFQVTAFQSAGTHNDAETFEITLQSSGVPNMAGV